MLYPHLRFRFQNEASEDGVETAPPAPPPSIDDAAESFLADLNDRVSADDDAAAATAPATTAAPVDASATTAAPAPAPSVAPGWTPPSQEDWLKQQRDFAALQARQELTNQLIQQAQQQQQQAATPAPEAFDPTKDFVPPREDPTLDSEQNAERWFEAYQRHVVSRQQQYFEQQMERRIQAAVQPFQQRLQQEENERKQRAWNEAIDRAVTAAGVPADAPYYKLVRGAVDAAGLRAAAQGQRIDDAFFAQAAGAWKQALPATAQPAPAATVDGSPAPLSGSGFQGAAPQRPPSPQVQPETDITKAALNFEAAVNGLVNRS